MAGLQVPDTGVKAEINPPAVVGPNEDTSDKIQLKDPKVFRVFFSSPFNGMEIERDLLTRIYFPQISSLCNAKGIQFVPVDMRWGITTEMAEDAQTINVCLREIDRSDVFVGIFGQRYGWHGIDDRNLQRNFDNAVTTYPWIDSKREYSVTELEFFHGHLNNPGERPAMIYFRDKKYDDSIYEEALSKNDSKKASHYHSEGNESTKRIEELKQKCKDVQEQSVQLETNYPKPEDGALLIKNAIEKLLGKLLPSSEEELTRLEKAQIEHDIFLESRCTNYVNGDEYISEFEKALELTVEKKSVEETGQKIEGNHIGKAGQENKPDVLVIESKIDNSKDLKQNDQQSNEELNKENKEKSMERETVNKDTGSKESENNEKHEKKEDIKVVVNDSEKEENDINTKKSDDEMKCDREIESVTKDNDTNNNSRDLKTKPLVILGSAGSGKSALISNWISRKRDKESDACIFYHFIGCTSDSNSIRNIFRRLLSFLYDAYNSNKDNRPQTALKSPDIYSFDMRGLKREVEQKLIQLQEQGRKLYIFIDGLDRLEELKHMEQRLYWVDKEYPGNTTVVLGTNSSDESNIEELVSKRGCPSFAIKPLDQENKEALCVSLLKLRGKTLAPPQLEKIMQKKETENPLFLIILLEELCMFGKFRQLDTKIDTLVGYNSTKELFTEFLERLEQDYNTKESEENVIEKVFCFFYVRNKGWRDEDVINMLKIQSHVWSPLYYGMEKFTLQQQGYIILAYDELKDAVFDRYIQTEEKKVKLTKDLITLMITEVDRVEDLGQKANKQQYRELPQLCYEAKDKDRLLKLMIRRMFFTELLTQAHDENDYKMLVYWEFIGHTPEQITDAYLKMADEYMAVVYMTGQEELRESNPGEAVLTPLYNITLFLGMAKYAAQQLKVMDRMERILGTNKRIDETKKQKELLDLYRKLGIMYSETYEPELCYKYNKMIVDYYEEHGCKNEEEEINLAFTCNGIGTACTSLSKFEESKMYLEKSIDIHTKLNRPQKDENCAISLSNIAQLYAKQTKYKEAIELYLEVIKKQEEIHFGAPTPTIAYAYTNIGIAYRKLKPPELDKAEEAYKKALEIKSQAYGEMHTDVAIAYVNFSNLALQRKKFADCQGYLEKARAIMMKLGEGDQPFCVHMVQENLALVLIRQNKHEEAEFYYWKVWDYLIARDQLDKGLKYVHTKMVQHFVENEMYDKAKKILPKLLQSQLCKPDNFIQLAAIESHLPLDQRTKYPHELTLDYGIEQYPENVNMLEAKITFDFAKSKDLEGSTAALKNFCDKSNSEIGSAEKLLDIVVSLEDENYLEHAEGILEFGIKYFQDKSDCQEKVQMMKGKLGDMQQKRKSQEVNEEGQKESKGGEGSVDDTIKIPKSYIPEQGEIDRLVASQVYHPTNS